MLQANLRPGDRIAVEDPGYTAVFDLVGALGLVVEPVTVDDFGPEPASLASALRAGVKALIVTPRAQNPTGAALDEKRVRALRPILDAHPSVLLLEDDHAGPVAGTPALTLAHAKREHWAVVRSVSKSLGPDLRLAVLAGDATTIARVEGRQHIGTGWVSHVLQEVVARLSADPRTEARLRAAASHYAAHRAGLIDTLRTHGIAAHGRSGFNVWIPVPGRAGRDQRPCGGRLGRPRGRALSNQEPPGDSRDDLEPWSGRGTPPGEGPRRARLARRPDTFRLSAAR